MQLADISSLYLMAVLQLVAVFLLLTASWRLAKGIDYVFWACSFLPLIGLLTIFLPNMNTARPKSS